MGRISAWIGIGFAALTAAQLLWMLSTMGGPLLLVGLRLAFIALLAMGSWRTLHKQKGGLRLLCGAWGIFVGESALAAMQSLGTPALSLIPLATFVIASAGLALTVLHKE